MNNKKTYNKIDLTDRAEKIRALLFVIISSALEVVGIVFAILHQLWGFILALIFPIFIYLTIKYFIAARGRVVYVKNDEISFEAEYRKITKIKKTELRNIYLNDPGEGKVEENLDKYKNIQIVFMLKDGKKYTFPLDTVRQDQLDILRSELL